MLTSMSRIIGCFTVSVSTLFAIACRIRSVLRLVLFQWNCFVLYNIGLIVACILRRLIDYFAPRRRSTTILKENIQQNGSMSLNDTQC